MSHRLIDLLPHHPWFPVSGNADGRTEPRANHAQLDDSSIHDQSATRSLRVEGTSIAKTSRSSTPAHGTMVSASEWTHASPNLPPSRGLLSSRNTATCRPVDNVYATRHHVRVHTDDASKMTTSSTERIEPPRGSVGLSGLRHRGLLNHSSCRNAVHGWYPYSMLSIAVCVARRELAARTCRHSPFSFADHRASSDDHQLG